VSAVFLQEQNGMSGFKNICNTYWNKTCVIYNITFLVAQTCLSASRRNFLGHIQKQTVIIINIKDWTLWSVPSPKLQLLSPTFLQSSNCSPSLWSVVVRFQRDSVLWQFRSPEEAEGWFTQKNLSVPTIKWVNHYKTCNLLKLCYWESCAASNMHLL